MMDERTNHNGNFGMSRVVELSHGKILIKPYSTAALVLVQREALERADLEEPIPPKRLIKNAFGGPQELEYTSLEELEGLEDDEEYDEWVEALGEYLDKLIECNRVQREAATRLIYLHSFHPCDDDGKPLGTDTMGAALDSIGLSVPDDTYELKRRYIECFLVGNMDEETYWLGREVTLMSRPQEEEVQAHFAGFLDQHRRTTLAQMGAIITASGGADSTTLSANGSRTRSGGNGDAVDEPAIDASAGEVASVVQGEE